MDFRMTGKTLRKVLAVLPEEEAGDFKQQAVNLLPGPFRKVADFLRIPTYGMMSSHFVDITKDLPDGMQRKIKCIIFGHR